MRRSSFETGPQPGAERLAWPWGRVVGGEEGVLQRLWFRHALCIGIGEFGPVDQELETDAFRSLYPVGAGGQETEATDVESWIKFLEDFADKPRPTTLLLLDTCHAGIAARGGVQ
jgi:hypothetical protein